MCLIIKSDNASELKQNLLTSAYHNNSDGFGGMFLADGKIQTFKHLPKTEADVIKFLEIYRGKKLLEIIQNFLGYDYLQSYVINKNEMIDIITQFFKNTEMKLLTP